MGRRGPPTGERNWNAKLTNDKVVAIKTLLAAGETAVHVAARYGVHRNTIRRISRAITWRHV